MPDPSPGKPLPDELALEEPFEELHADDEDDERSLPVDPAIIYILAVVVMTLGLSNFAPVVRYTMLWTVLAVVAPLALLADRVEVERPRLRDLMVGVVYGLIVGVPVLLLAGQELQRISLNVFGKADDVTVFQAAFFAMPLAETLFFRGAFQATRGLLFATGAASLWTILMFFPSLNVLEFPFVALVIGIFFVFINFVYSYLRERSGLFSSWTCQVTINVLLLFVSRLLH
jgi:hypothetical protein